MKKKRKYYREYWKNYKVHLKEVANEYDDNDLKKDVISASLTIAFILIGFVTACIINYYGG